MPDTLPFLLTRDEFREAVFARDGRRCVICAAPGVDAHHIVERRLFDDGGYYLDNGATLCEACHMRAEMTVLSCDEIREAAGVTQVVLPPHLYRDERYDKWGNILLPNGSRLRGELFYDGSVQKILAAGGVLGLFTDRVRYPRTCHLPWSPGVTDDDRVLTDLSAFEEREVVVTVKMDGEQTTMYRDYLHSRSLEWRGHPSRSWVANLHGQIGWKIPDGWRICGENLYAKHSIEYHHLPSYFLLFSVWNEQNVCLPWAETAEWAALLDLQTVPALYQGVWDEALIRNLYTSTFQGDEMEGYVVRLADAFPYGSFRRSMAKYVRAGHDHTRPHWFHGQQMVVNSLDHSSETGDELSP
jgi:hypothetical protein